MKLSEAHNIANDFTRIIKPFTTRIEIAGSIRRECEEVKDIDIVISQHPFKLEQFFMGECRRHGISTVRTDPLMKKLKYGSRHKQVLFKGNTIDLFFASPKNWGLILLIRTGSANFSRDMLTKWKQVSKGGYSRNGILRTAKDEPVFVPEEDSFFKLINIAPVHPGDRSI